MIVVVGIPSEGPSRLVLDAARRLGVEAVVLNPREAAASDLTLRQEGGRIDLMLDRAGERRALGDVRGVYTRLGAAEPLPEFASGTSEARARIQAWHEIVNDWMEVTPARILNRLKACNTNMSKPHQIRLIAACGLDVPRTLVTNDPERALAFRAAHGAVIFKSISAQRSIVRRLEGGYLARLKRLRGLPVQFQEEVPGTDLRVHVVGDAVFPTRIESVAQDYRYAAADGESARFDATDLPPAVADACLGVSRALGLPLCGIDLRVTPEGRYVCFEANPSPAYSCYEERTGQPIAAAIVRWLETGDAKRRNRDADRRKLGPDHRDRHRHPASG